MRRKPRTKEITTAKVGGKNPIKLKKSIIAIAPPLYSCKTTDDARMHPFEGRLSENARKLVSKKANC